LDGAAMLTIYPSLPGRSDFGILRISGNGIGNCFYAYFHAVVLASQHGAQLVAPTWWSVKLGPLLRGELSLRRYGTMFRPHPDEISGFGKFVRLTTSWHGRERVRIRMGQRVGQLPAGGLVAVEAPAGEFTFCGLHSHRDMIRSRLLEILACPPGEIPRWGRGGYAAAHIRLGDFRPTRSDQLSSLKDGLRIPLAWYEKAIRRVRALLPELPVFIFSDGHAHELANITAIRGVTLRREPSDIADLLALAQAELLIGSNSTFSRWAAFLGNMPSIWVKTDQVPEQPTSKGVPIVYVGEDFESINREMLGNTVQANNHEMAFSA
jgi:Glycosyl transferase family 11